METTSEKQLSARPLPWRTRIAHWCRCWAVVLLTTTTWGCTAQPPSTRPPQPTPSSKPPKRPSPPRADAPKARRPADELAQRAEAAWAQRHKRPKLEAAIDLWRRVSNQKPHDTDLWTRQARANFLLAEHFLRSDDDAEARINVLERAILAGERAMMSASQEFVDAVENRGESVREAVQYLGADAQAAMYWYAAALGRFALLKGLTTAMIYRERILAVMQRVLAIDATFFYGAAHRFFGAYYARVPAFAGGDLPKAREHFEKALEIAPDFLQTRVLFAHYIATKSDDRELFERLLRGVIEADPATPEAVAPEQHMAQTRAEHLLANAEARF